MKSFLRKKPSEWEELEAEEPAPPASAPAGPAREKASPAKTAASSRSGLDDEDDGGGGDNDDGADRGGGFWGRRKSKREKRAEPEPEPEPQPQPKRKSGRGKEAEPASAPAPESESKSKSKSSCCRCCACCTPRRLLSSLLLLLLLAAGAVLAWRYGPWFKNEPTTQSLALPDDCDDCCNGLPSLCDVPIDDALFPVVHRAHSSYDRNFVGAHNARGFEGALVAGYRGLQLTSCVCERLAALTLLERNEAWGLGDSAVGFCNGPCGAGVRDVKDALTSLKTFLDANPREVLILDLEFGEGSSADLRAALRYSGLLDYAYQPLDVYYIEEWPTLGQLIEENRRLLIFGSGDGMDSCPVYDCDDGILYATDHVARTATDGSDLDSCAPAAGTSTSTAGGQAPTPGHFLMNHFAQSGLRMPSPRRARELNAYGTLEERMESCDWDGGRRPNLLAVEFWDEGDAVEFARIMNEGKNRDGGEYETATEGADDEGSRKRWLRGWE